MEQFTSKYADDAVPTFLNTLKYFFNSKNITTFFRPK